LDLRISNNEKTIAHDSYPISVFGLKFIAGKQCNFSRETPYKIQHMRIYLVTIALVAALPASAADWYKEMQIGPAWSNSFSGMFDEKEQVAAIKGVLVDLGEGKRALFDTEAMRVVTAYSGDVDWGGTPWTGTHGKLVRVTNEKNYIFNTNPGPGWADEGGSFDDSRPKHSCRIYGEDDQVQDREVICGNIKHASYKGFYRHGQRIIFEYIVNGTRVLEHLQADKDGLVRHFEVAAHAKPLVMLAAEDGDDFEEEGSSLKSKSGLSVAVGGEGAVLSIAGNAKRVIATLAPSEKVTTFTISCVRGAAAKPTPPFNVSSAMQGGEGIWKEAIITEGQISQDKESPWVTDTLTLPIENPWQANLRFAAFDFINEDSAAIASWNGDVWVVSGLKGDWKKLSWRRFASGLFEPLGLKVVNGTVIVHGRDQLTKLHDLNQDGEADRYECFFNGVAVSPNFHEFAFDLQTDSEGNFYFAKAAPVRPGGRGFDPIFPHHGTIMKLSPDGGKLEVVATGLRAPAGVGVGPNGELSVGENEGSWQPCCKISYITKEQRPAFFGTEPTRHLPTKVGFTEPLCYLPMDVDNSGGAPAWVPPSATNAGVKPGEMLHLSYGKSSIFRVLNASVDNVLQGGVVKLPINLGSSAMRLRFHPDGSMYVAGFRGWQTNAANESAFQRIRYIGTAMPVPDKLEITEKGVRLHFETPLDKELATDPGSYSAQRWDYVHSSQYGSGEFSVDNPDVEARNNAVNAESQSHRKRDEVKISSARLLDDGQTVEIDLEGHKNSMQLKLAWDLESSKGEVLKGDLHATVRKMGK
jgi:hypothetical protein